MRNHWLIFLTFGMLGLIIFVLYWVRLQPIETNLSRNQEVETISEPTITFVNPTIGPDNAKVTIVEFSDFQCEHCRTLATALEAVQRTFPKDVRVVWKDFPNESIHPEATKAAVAAHCADRQNAFWPYHNELFKRQTFLSDEQFTSIAEDIGLDTKRFTKCVETSDTLPIVRKDFKEGLGLSLTATPTVFINNERYVGSISINELTTIIQRMLKN